MPAATVDERIINPATRMDAVTLLVGDLAGMSSYYSEALALEPIAESAAGSTASQLLGRGGVPLVRLEHRPGLPVGDRHGAGLFHTAFLLDSPAGLAATLQRAARHRLSRYVGAGDHLVSEAFYFTDPEGNGIEIYADRDRASWPRAGGQIMMDTRWLDPREYLSRHLTEEAWRAGSALPGVVGHVHLQVGDLARAREFYVTALGFEITATMPGALFVSAGGYHHHLAMNTWSSAGAGPRAAGLGLGEVAITVPGREDLDALRARLKRLGIDHRDEGDRVELFDPWRTRVSVNLAAG